MIGIDGLIEVNHDLLLCHQANIRLKHYLWHVTLIGLA
jgi:hypothetical protein